MRQLGPLGLDDGEVQLWVVRLEASDHTFSRAFSWLSPDEVERADRFRFDKHRRAFVLGRAALRALIGGYLRFPPEEASFNYGLKGKPSLSRPPAPYFSTCPIPATLRLTPSPFDCEIGVDVEHRRRLLEIESIAQRFFAREEVAELMSLSESERPDGFFNCWTRKEAYIKAVGDGLSVPLDSFRVTLLPGVPARMVDLDGSTVAAERWNLHAFTPEPEYAGAIAYRDEPRLINPHPLTTADDLLERLG